ncbi:hypothetical protein HYH03_005469 [Edaphochlamys debaryana]|uniref:Uncharacterized protein n=1 Tax=Edaphochlamys debaryana TaxID=47281 RepID=A0A835Y7N9_9CHLO|nr:hypothetical protein HYH03_005469 [Edaphochlamys debaryana]|eukprot:KAG2496649.1 hypothetical protein HYH03_005469 [Edaphochlamys debaryana]
MAPLLQRLSNPWVLDVTGGGLRGRQLYDQQQTNIEISKLNRKVVPRERHVGFEVPTCTDAAQRQPQTDVEAQEAPLLRPAQQQRRQLHSLPAPAVVATTATLAPVAAEAAEDAAVAAAAAGAEAYVSQLLQEPPAALAPAGVPAGAAPGKAAAASPTRPAAVPAACLGQTAPAEGKSDGRRACRGVWAVLKSLVWGC